ncbi:hypothetical protein GOBAR_AA18001 [Gossypium barbadense]|uniref:CID domain-containing protein n=1 Tax=Gossypium barbadense TaxID=3634 RepID=A0A2P5XH63_GOSBA|nr:hypothetical protein GOBAR_AA18001 [Gossypium barbadense]
MNKAKQVVETWDRQFHCSPREQRLAFLYLANDILQNSRRKGSEFVGEFWKVLPDALRDVIESGDEFGRNAALRLISIWEERKVFGSRGQILKEELFGRQPESNNRNGRHINPKLLKQPVGDIVDKIVSGYQFLYCSQMDEDVIFSKCRNAISCMEKVDKEISTDVNSGQFCGSALVGEVQGQHAALRDCIEQLTAVASSRVNLISHLREALKEQEFKLEQVRSQLQAVAAKLTASTSSAQMLSYVLSSLASEGVLGNPMKESSGDYSSEKRPKLENDQPYIPSQNLQQALVPPCSHPESHLRNVATTTRQLTPNEVPPPTSSSSSPLRPVSAMAPYAVSQYMPTTGLINGAAYSYGMTTASQQHSLPGYSVVGGAITGLSPFPTPLTNISYQSFQGSEVFYNQPSSVPAAPNSRH